MANMTTALLERMYREAREWEIDLIARKNAGANVHPDALEEAADRTCRRAAVLREFGVEVCEYCGLVRPEQHTSDACPWAALERHEINVEQLFQRLALAEQAR